MAHVVVVVLLLLDVVGAVGEETGAVVGVVTGAAVVGDATGAGVVTTLVLATQSHGVKTKTGINGHSEAGMNPLAAAN
jgi:hypothetical protein